MSNESSSTCQFKVIHVNSKDLPLSCPMPSMTLWNAHPKVYLPIQDSKQEICPYCGTKYQLDEE
jgi:uncharacterized Zn-finger protein